MSLVATFERSTLPAAKFCSARGLTLATFRWWRSELRRGGAPVAAMEPVRLLSVDVAEARPRPVTHPDGYPVTIHDAVVKARRRGATG